MRKSRNNNNKKTSGKVSIRPTKNEKKGDNLNLTRERKLSWKKEEVNTANSGSIYACLLSRSTECAPRSLLYRVTLASCILRRRVGGFFWALCARINDRDYNFWIIAVDSTFCFWYCSFKVTSFIKRKMFNFHCCNNFYFMKHKDFWNVTSWRGFCKKKDRNKSEG